MEFNLLLPIIFLTTLIVFVYIPFVGLFRYYRPLKMKIWANILGIFLAIITWPLVPIILVLRNKDVFLTRLFWIGFVIWLCSFTYFIIHNIKPFLETVQQYNTAATD